MCISENVGSEYALFSQFMYDPSSDCTKQEVDETGTRESHQTAKRERETKRREEKATFVQ